MLSGPASPPRLCASVANPWWSQVLLRSSCVSPTKLHTSLARFRHNWLSVKLLAPFERAHPRLHQLCLFRQHASDQLLALRRQARHAHSPPTAGRPAARGFFRLPSAQPHDLPPHHPNSSALRMVRCIFWRLRSRFSAAMLMVTGPSRYSIASRRNSSIVRPNTSSGPRSSLESSPPHRPGPDTRPTLAASFPLRWPSLHAESLPETFLVFLGCVKGMRRRDM